MRKKSNKLIKLEKERYSIFEDDRSDKCFNCGLKCKGQMHEIYGGSNRQRSMKNGLCVHLCNECHHNEELIMNLRKIGQLEYEKTHKREDFIQLIGRSYLD